LIKAVVFDLDNTLLDFMSMKSFAVKAAIKAMIEAGLPLDEKKAYDKIISIYDEKGYEYQKVFDDFILNECNDKNYKALASGISAYRKAREASLALYPNVNSTLIKLIKMGLLLGVVSDAPSREAWMRICQLNLHHIFDSVVTFNDTGYSKPAPEPFQKICFNLNVKPNEVLMIGDWPERDVVGAKKVGMITAFAKYGDTFNTVHSNADYDIVDIAELINIIKKENNI
tara:strand:+ start:286 stop:969 length:684 start_codon:yes stop_codon:yes gene_type:complete